jgi:hypothetical protein
MVVRQHINTYHRDLFLAGALIVVIALWLHHTWWMIYHGLAY